MSRLVAWLNGKKVLEMKRYQLVLYWMDRFMETLHMFCFTNQVHDKCIFWNKEMIFRDAVRRSDSNVYIFGSEFWTMYNWPFSDLEHCYYTWFRPQLLRNHFFWCRRKEYKQGFQETYTLYTFTHFCTSHGPPNAKKWQKVMFLHFFIFSEPSCKFSSYITDII